MCLGVLLWGSAVKRMLLGSTNKKYFTPVLELLRPPKMTHKSGTHEYYLNGAQLIDNIAVAI